MRKLCALFAITVSIYGIANYAVVFASTTLISYKTISVELTVNSPGADGAQFILNGLETPAVPIYNCASKTSVSDALGNGKSVHFALVDLSGIDKVKITVNGKAVGKLSITNDSYINSSGKNISGRITLRQLK